MSSTNNLILNAKLSLDSDVPLYNQLVAIIKRHISAGILVPGDLLPSESELCKALSISRSTVRQAIGALESEGLVVRRWNPGTPGRYSRRTPGRSLRRRYKRSWSRRREEVGEHLRRRQSRRAAYPLPKPPRRAAPTGTGPWSLPVHFFSS